jgi:hypothetical protein
VEEVKAAIDGTVAVANDILQERTQQYDCARAVWQMEVEHNAWRTRTVTYGRKTV